MDTYTHSVSCYWPWNCKIPPENIHLIHHQSTPWTPVDPSRKHWKRQGDLSAAELWFQRAQEAGVEADAAWNLRSWGANSFAFFFPGCLDGFCEKMYHFVVDKIKHFTKWVPKSLTRQLELIPSQWRIVLFRNWHYFTALWLILSVFSSNMSWFQPVDMVFPCFSVDHIKISHLACNVRPRLSWQHWGGEQDFQLCQNGDFCVFFDFVADDTINIPASCMSFFRIFVLGILALLMMNVF